MDGSQVYADLTFLINFVMDFCILWTTARLADIQIVYSRIIIASILGGIYALGYLIATMSAWYSLPMKLLFSCLLIIFALGPGSWNEFKKAFLYFYVIGFVAAGAAIGVSYLFADSAYEGSFSYLCLLGGIFCIIAMGVYGARFLKQRVIPGLLRFNVELKFDEKFCKGQGFLDTGNGLRDPLTNRPVLVAEYSMLKSCLPLDLQIVMEEEDDNSILDAITCSSWAERVRLIPFTSIGKRNGILIGVRADEVRVNTGRKDVLHKDLVVGIYKEKLSGEGNYQLLIPAEIVEAI